MEKESTIELSKEEIISEVEFSLAEVERIWKSSTSWIPEGRESDKGPIFEATGLVDWEDMRNKVIALMNDWPEENKELIKTDVVAVFDALEKESDLIMDEFLEKLGK